MIQVCSISEPAYTSHQVYTDLSDDLKTTLIEEYSCEKKPDDGEIYSKIREYQGYGGGGNPYFESRWWALLHGKSSHKSDNMKQIIRNPDFRAAFDIQLDVPGLGGGMSLGSTHKVFGMKCVILLINDIVGGESVGAGLVLDI